MRLEPRVKAASRSTACGPRKRDLALPLAEEALKLTKAKLGPDHPGTLGAMNRLAQIYVKAWKMDLALPLIKEALKFSKGKLGPDHPETLNLMNNLATVYAEKGKHDLAIPLLEESFTLKKTKLGPEHPDTLTTMSNLAGRTKVMPDDFLTFNTQSILGGALLGQQKFEEAEPLLLAG